MLSPPDAELADREPELPGMALLLDGLAFTGRIRELVPELRVEELVPAYVRYKPRTSCLVAYQEAAAGIPTLYAVSRHRSAAEKLRKAQPRPGADAGTAIRVLSEEGVEIRGARHDAELPALARFLDPSSRRQMLEARFSHLPELAYGGLVPLAYKPERRFVARLDGYGESNGVLRLYTDYDFEAAADAAMAFRSRAELRIARFLGRSSRNRALLLEWLSGEPLPDLLAGAGWRDEVLERIGVALAELHAQAPKGLARRTVAPLVPDLSRAVAAVAALRPHLTDRAARIARKIAEFLQAAPAQACWIHGDFYADQLVATSEGIGVLDLDRARRDDPATDLGEFIGHLERDVLAGTRSRAELQVLRGSLLAGYGARDGSLLERVRIHSAAALLRLVDAPFRYRQADWPESMDRILTRADEIAGSAARMFHPTGPGPDRDPPIVRACAAERLATDPAFSFVLPALDPEHVERRFTCVLEERLGVPVRIEARSVRVVRHKLGRRCLLEYDLWIEQSGCPPEPMPLLGKVRARGLDQRSHDAQLALWRNGFGTDHPGGVSVPEPIGVLPELRMWLQRRVPGESPLSLLSGESARETARRIVHAVDRLHRAGFAPNRAHEAADELRILRERLGQLARTRPRLGDRLERVLAGCERILASLPPLDTRAIHRDFYHDQLLVDGDRIYLLDLDLLCKGDPALDIGNFIAHLLEHGLRTSGGFDVFEDARAEIEQRFARLNPVPHAAAAVDAYTSVALARHIQISTRLTEREPFTELLLELCESRLARALGDPVP